MSTSRHRLTRAVAGALAVTALAAPTASALPAEQVQGSYRAPSGADHQRPLRAPAPTVTRTIDEGFDVGSAAIGAGGAAALLLLTAAGATTLSRRNQQVGVVR